MNNLNKLSAISTLKAPFLKLSRWAMDSLTTLTK